MSMSAKTPKPASIPKRFVLAHPLDEFYARAGLPMPSLQELTGKEVPEPYRSLLVHENDMTPTLEQFYGQDIHLRVLSRRRKRDEYVREVVLVLDGSNRPVECGAIKINLKLFSPDARAEILEERRPLGHILNERHIAHTSLPKAFLLLTSDHLINEVLGLTGANILYGRRNTLFNPKGRPLAEIVEILPPLR